MKNSSASEISVNTKIAGDVRSGAERKGDTYLTGTCIGLQDNARTQ